MYPRNRDLKRGLWGEKINQSAAFMLWKSQSLTAKLLGFSVKLLGFRKSVLRILGLDLISLPNVDGKTLAKVIEYCSKHAEGGDLEKFDEEFLDVDVSVLYDLIMAANYLSIKSLFENDFAPATRPRAGNPF